MARAQSILQQHQSIIKLRTLIVFGVIAALYLLLAGRLFYLQTVRHSYFQKQAESYRVSSNRLLARRGQLLDRNGEALAINVPAAVIYADPREIKDPAGTASVLAPILGVDVNALESRLIPKSKKNHYVSLMRHAPLALGQQVRTANLPGVGVGPDTQRCYPNGELAAQVLGFTDNDTNGVEGIERSQDKLLRGHDGQMVGEIDREGRFLPGTIRRQQEPENGSDLVLTIDKTLQHAADTELAAAVKAHGAKSGVVVALDPRTGEILALSNAPSYNPNLPRPLKGVTPELAKTLVARWRNSAVSDLYEPGSTLKTITASAVLQEQGLDMMKVHVHCDGVMMVGKHAIHCAQDPPYFGHHGDEDMRGVLKESCNIGMAQFGMKLGADSLYKYEKSYGFLDYPRSGLPGEQKSWLQSPDAFNKYTQSVGWSKIELANISFGQGISVTPLQLAAAYGAIANDGVMMRPHILKSIIRHDVDTPVAPEAAGKVLSPEVAAAVRSMLGTVVQAGTGKPSQIAGFSMGGKTGSAQVAGPHGYENGRYVASFIGLVPLNHPRLVILCAVFEPKGVHWGAAVAAPVVHNLAKVATLEMHLIPDSPQTVDWEDHLRSAKHRENIATNPATINKMEDDNVQNDRQGRPLHIKI